MDREPDTDASQQPEGRPKPYLLGGSGWERRTSALQSGGRYVPKGGHIVDLSARGSIRSDCSSLGLADALREPPPAAPGAVTPSLPTRWAERIALRHTHDVLLPTSPPGPGCMHGEEAGEGLRGYGEAIKSDRDAAAPSVPHSSALGGGEPARRQWRPPGPTTPTRSLRLVGGARRINGVGAGARRKASKALPPPAHDCANCECCAEARSKLEAAEAAARQDRTAATTLRRRLDSALAALARERADFEAYKDAEMTTIRAAASDAVRRQQRDRMAEGARARAAVRGTAAAASQERAAEVEALRAELEAVNKEAERAEGRHRVEKERLRREVARLERQCGELTAGIAAAETDRLQAWEEANKAKAEVEVLRGHVQAKDRGLAAEENQPDDDGTGGGGSCIVETPRSVSSSTYPKTNALAAPKPPRTAPEKTDCLRPAATTPSCTAADPHVISYPNGTVRRNWLDGHAATVFSNGDIKQEYPSGAVEYFFSEVGVWQVTHPSAGVETFFFPCGKVESHLPDGSKETLLPGAAGALRTGAGGSGEMPVAVSALCRETLAPKPAPLRL